MYTWPVARECLPEIDSDDAPEDVLKLQAAVDTAVMVLWSLTGRAYAVEQVIARPCPRLNDLTSYDTRGVTVTGFIPLLIDGGWQNVDGCSAGCTVDGRGVVTLPGPVVSIDSVTVDGTEIAAESYHLEGNYLYRTAGGAWPAQDMTLPTGTPGTWSVKYQRGVAPPPGAALAVGQLAKEFWNICSGSTKACRLPKRWQTIQRQGVTITRADPTDILAQGYTGLPEVDMWVKALNPHQLTQPARVQTPDYSSTVI